MSGARRRVAIVGSGAFGLVSALELRRRGWEVDLVDPGPVPRPEAASTDISKIVRMDYGRDALLTEMAESALPEWRRWNDRFGEELYHEVGFLLLARAPFRPGGFEHDSMTLLASRGHAVTRLDASRLAARFPAWNADVYPDAYVNATAGWAASGRVVARLAFEAAAGGVRLRTGDAVRGLAERGARVLGVELASGERILSDVVLVAAGAWTPELLPAMSGVMWPVAQPVFHLAPEDPSRWVPPRFTVWAADIAQTGWYGFPAQAGVVKIANHGPGRRVRADAPRTTTPDDAARLRAFLAESLPELADAPLAASKTCLYCDSFAGDFWIGLDPDRPGLAVAAGDSGHGFKFAPVLGAVVADAIEGVATRFTRRFGWRAKGPRRAEDARFGRS